MDYKKDVLVYDLETPKGCFLASFYDFEKGFIDFIIWEQKNQLYEFIQFLENNKHKYYVGFNNLNFDNQVIEWIYKNYDEFALLSNLEITEKIYKYASKCIENSNYSLWSDYREDELTFKPIDVFKIQHFDNKNRRVGLKRLEVEMDMDDVREFEISPDKQDFNETEIKDLIDESGDTLFDLNAAVQEFKDAQESLNEAAWMQTELDTLSSIDDNISLLYAAASAYYDSIGQDVPDYAKQIGSGAGLLSNVTSASGIQLNDLIFNTLAAKIQQMMDNDTYSDLAASTAIFGSSSSFRDSMGMGELLSTVGNYSDDYSFADGGIISGPSSGYQMPNTTFHGTEAIIPLTGGSIPIEIKNGEQNITVVVKVGNRELKDITTEIIRTDPEAQKQIRRVANG